MAIPDFPSIMAPLLIIAGDGQEHSLPEVTNLLARQYELSPEEKNEMIPSGKQQKFHKRVAWAKTIIIEVILTNAIGLTLPQPVYYTK